MAWFTQAITKKYALFSGRSGRREFWMYTLFLFITLIVVGIIAGILGGVLGQTGATIGGALYGIVVLGVLCPTIAMSVRRLHDMGYTGWWYLASFIPGGSAVLLILFAIKESQPGDNKYGADPTGSTPLSAAAAAY
jgi:uncharacterized membrane protein YhaH (DUF805 family)